jgi:hypothetical protein
VANYFSFFGFQESGGFEFGVAGFAMFCAEDLELR